MERGKIIIIEGTSCVGKTTLCSNLKEKGWIIIPEAIRYLEDETGKVGDEASPIPDSQEEEEYYQDQLFRVEKAKLIEANKLRQQGKKVVIDKSAIATVATAKAFEVKKWFEGTFRRAYLKYIDLLQELKNRDLVECDVFMLLTANYDTICKRNKMRNHVLDGIWIDENTISSQRGILEKMIGEIVGCISKNDMKKVILDTSNLGKRDVLDRFNNILNRCEREKFKIK